MNGAFLRRLSQDLPPRLLDQEREQRASLLALAGGSRDSSASRRRRVSSSASSFSSSTFSDVPYNQQRASLIPLAGSRVGSERSSRRSSGCFSDKLLDSSDPDATHAHIGELVDGVALDAPRQPSAPTNMGIDEQQQNAGSSRAASQRAAVAAATAGNVFREFVSRLVAHVNASSPERRQPDTEREALDQVALETVAAAAASALLDEEIGLIARVHTLFWRQSLFRALANPRSLLAIAGVECANEGDEAEAAADESALSEHRFPSAPSGSPDLSTRMSVSEAEA